MSTTSPDSPPCKETTFQDLVMTRYATKSFDSRPVSEDLIAKLKEIVRFTPTSFNLQPWRAQIVSDEKTRDRLLPASWNQPQITTCSHLFVFCACTDLTPLVERLQSRMLGGGVPSEQVNVFVGMIRDFLAKLDSAEALAWAQKQTYLALGNGLIGARSLGFDSCPMEGFVAEQYREILGLPDHLVPTVLMPVGHANDTPRKKLRFETEELFF